LPGPRNTNRTRYVLALLVLAAITLVTIDEKANGGGISHRVRSVAQEVFAPLQRETHSLLQPVGDFFSGALHYGDLKRENALLRQELAQQTEAVLAAQNAETQNELLLQNDHLDYAGSVPRVACQVTDQSAPSNYEQTIELNCGTHDGVTVGMPVVSGAGLVGQINFVSGDTSTVLLLTDPSFSVGVRLDTAGDPGVATGGGQGRPMTVNPLDTAVKLEKGAVLETSGLANETFPPGIPVARVVATIRQAGSLQPQFDVQPIVDGYTLQFVDVLQWSRQ
jgi:rod shape-determining protein MreC